ncbi:MAG: type II toxin-antitoxin system YoeB family toxin [Kiritimatiellia bacterium]|nr:type II toxin-antitoxin system YoeB family toxin [Kiritimatiellia bacterium]
MRYRIRFTKRAAKDVKTLTPKLQTKLKQILRNRVAKDPYSGKRLVGELKGYYSVRLTYKDRIVYAVHDDELVVLIIRARTHYGD